jgi:hypothetical protein
MNKRDETDKTNQIDTRTTKYELDGRDAGLVYLVYLV